MSNTVGVMSYKWWLDVIKRGCDVLYSANDANHYPCDVIQSVSDVVNGVRVMTQINGCNVTCIVYRWPTYRMRFHI